MEKMSSLTFPDGSTYEIVDAEARMEVSKTQEVTTDKFNSDIDYAAGDLCIYNNVLYKFITSKSAGEWDSEAVVVTSVKNEMNDLKNEVNALNSKSEYKFGCCSFWTNGAETKNLLFDIPSTTNGRPIFFISGNIGHALAFSMCTVSNLNETLQTPNIVDITHDLSELVNVEVNADGGNITKLRIKITSPDGMGSHIQILVPSGNFVAIR